MKLNNFFAKRPIAIKQLGDKVFLKNSFYNNEHENEVIYINPELYEKVFGKPYIFKSASKDIIEKFAVTLYSNGKSKGYAYTDKQSDPTDIALNGNKGSGRAIYIYKYFNIKGIKTPLACSSKIEYNNGKYSLDAAIQECLISNIINTTKKINNFQTLAIIDIKEKYLFPYVENELPCALIIRYYEKKELYRFSHRFVNNINFSSKDLKKIAKKIGIMEGNKFIYRFLHGAWSIGNLSISCNMIDFDTSFFVLGRNPQFSYTDRHITNYFGYEYKGQTKVLETIVNSKLNVDNINIEILKLIIEKEYNKTIRKNFVKLLGYNEEIYYKYKNIFDKLADEFNYLSRVMYNNYENLNTLDIHCEETNIFDFSNLFRYYHIYKMNNSWNAEIGLKLLLNEKSCAYCYENENLELKKRINDFFSDYIINTEVEYFDIISRAKRFIENFNQVNEYISFKEKVNYNFMLVKAYIENENKIYLTGSKQIRLKIIEFYNKNDANKTNQLINNIIQFYSYKDYSRKWYLCDLLLFEDGIMYKKVNFTGSFNYCLRFYDNQEIDNIVIKNNKINIKLKRNKNNEFISQPFKYNELINDFQEYMYLHINEKTKKVKFF